MRKQLLTISFFIITLVCEGSAIELPRGWDQSTCKITTGSSIGTGFLLEYKSYKFVVSNKHVLHAENSSIHLVMGDALKNAFKILKEKNIYLPIDTTKPIPIPVSKENYFGNPDSSIDIALYLLPPAGNYDFVCIPENVIGADSMVIPGKEIFFLGYPAGLTGQDITIPLVRWGIISGISFRDIVIDGNIFGGSSGSPIFLKDLNDNKIKLIGIIKGNIGQKDNLDIGVGIKVNKIIETLDLFLEKLSQKNSNSK